MDLKLSQRKRSVFHRYGLIIAVVVIVSCIHLFVFSFSSFTNLFKKTTKKPDLEIEISSPESVQGQDSVVLKSDSIKEKTDKKYEKSKLKKPQVQDSSSNQESKEEIRSTDSAVNFEQAGKVGTAPSTVDDHAPKILSNPKPQYPLDAYAHRQEGRVVLYVEILESGSVGQVNVANSSGIDSIDASALKAVGSWKFSPAQAAGKIVKQWIKLPIDFKLRKQ